MMRRIAVVALGGMLLFPVGTPAEPTPAKSEQGYEQKYILDEAVSFFGEASEDLAKVIERAFADHGRPNAYIKGEEAGGAIIFGLRYGNGILQRQAGAGEKIEVFWKGPSVGFDWGGNVSKTFILIYNLPDTERLHQRFPGVEGALYFIGGVGMTYHQSESIVVAPIRVGVGLRAGANVGYLHFTGERSWVPF